MAISSVLCTHLLGPIDLYATGASLDRRRGLHSHHLAQKNLILALDLAHLGIRKAKAFAPKVFIAMQM